ncbi:MAG: hypothetical protein AAGG68_23505 [Bacteroidota bacterium]
MVKEYPNHKNKNSKNSNELLDAANNADEKPPPLYVFSKVLGKYVLAHEEEQLIKEQKDKAELWDSLFSKLLDDAIKQANELLAYHQEQIAFYFKAIENHIALLQLLADQQMILQQEKTNFEENGRFELDENGQLKNQEAEQLLQEWEAKTGTTIDRNSPETYYTILQMLNEIEEQKEATYQQLERDEAAYEYHKEQRDQAEQIVKDLQSDDINIQKAAIQKLGALNIDEKRDVSINLNNNDTNNSTPSPSKNNGFVEEDFEMSDFEFGFPDLQSNFKTSVEGEEGSPENKIETNIQTQTILKIPSI